MNFSPGKRWKDTKYPWTEEVSLAGFLILVNIRLKSTFCVRLLYNYKQSNCTGNYNLNKDLKKKGKKEKVTKI